MLTTKQFLETYLCKAGESISQVSENEWEVQRWTTQTFKRLGNVFAANQYDTEPKDEILKLRLRPNSKRKSLPITDKMKEEALNKGWLIQEIRFKKDERTPLSIHYRMGPGLFIYEKLIEEEQESADHLLKETLQGEIRLSEKVLPTSFVKGLQQFVAKKIDSDNWGKERVRKFTHFLIAYLRLRREKSRMEYKEIGATYYQKIGGSKEFDRYREVFIGRLEKWIGAPVEEIGIVSQGSIVPIYFTGHLTGEFSQYSIGTVHTTNDIAVAAESYSTNAKVLWLVENRAVLTRMAAEVRFLGETNSFVLGVDGQIRGAHRKMIQQICEGKSVGKVMIWVDYDKSGDVIARELVGLVGTLSYRMIGNEENIFTTYDTYVKWSTTVPHAEQEMTLGGEENWRRWINQ